MTVAKTAHGVETLYKYMAPPGATQFSATNLASILHDGQIRLASSQEVNDPFEYFPHVSGEPTAEGIFNVIERIKNRPDSGNLVTEELRKGFVQRTGRFSRPDDIDKETFQQLSDIVRRFTSTQLQTVGFISLTTNPSSVLMWAHYAQNHSGVCIGWDANKSEFPGHALQVRYSEDRPEIPIQKFLENEMQMDRETTFSMLNTKSSDWSYEQEWRYFGASIRDREVTRGGGYVDFEKSHIKSIAFGLHTTEETKAFIMEQIKDYEKKPQIFQARRSDVTFDVELQNI